MTDMIDLSNAILETWPELRPAFEGMTAAQIVGVTRELLAAPTKDYAASPPENPAPGERAVARAAGWFPLRARELRAAPARTWAASSLVPLHLGPLRLRGRPVLPRGPETEEAIYQQTGSGADRRQRLCLRLRGADPAFHLFAWGRSSDEQSARLSGERPPVRVRSSPCRGEPWCRLTPDSADAEHRRAQQAVSLWPRAVVVRLHPSAPRGCSSTWASASLARRKMSVRLRPSPPSPP